jgi:hypothetical protein
MATEKFPGPVPQGALDYIKNKDLRVGFHYQDVWGAEHAHGFTVSKMMKLDLLSDTQASLAAAVQNGETFRAWAKKIKPEMQKRGWWGVKKQIDPRTGKVHSVQLGSARRLRIIYNANMRAARAAGQWQRIQRNKGLVPYLLYQLGPSIHHRPQHVAWLGTLLPVDNAFWAEAYPPSAYGCKCWVQAVTEHRQVQLKRNGFRDPLAPQEINPKTGLPTGRRVKRTRKVQTTAPRLRFRRWTNKRTGEILRVPEGVDPAWAGNTGANRLAVLRQGLAGKLDAADQQLAHAAVTTIVRSPILPQYLAEVKRQGHALLGPRVAAAAAADSIGELPIGFIDADLRAKIGSRTQLVRLSLKSTAKQFETSRQPSADAYRLLDDVLGSGTVIRAPGGEYLVVHTLDGTPYRAVLQVPEKKTAIYLTSFHALDDRTLQQSLRSGKVIRRGKKQGARQGA